MTEIKVTRRYGMEILGKRKAKGKLLVSAHGNVEKFSYDRGMVLLLENN